MKKTLLYICCFLSISCSDKGNNIQRDLTILKSSPISISKKLSIIYNGEDTTINNLCKSKLKLVIYTDSKDCSSCGINKMPMWDPLLRYAERFKGELRFYFIFNPANNSIINELRNAMRVNPINYPVLIDKNGDFEKLNPHLPKNKAMHTFLLDENNKVILVGNPLYNKEIEKLFYKITQEKLSK